MKAVSVHELTPAQMLALGEAMALDGDEDTTRYMSHVLYDDSGAIRGAFSVTCGPVLFFWMDARKGQGIASLRALRLATAMLAERGYPNPILPCSSKSPFYVWLTALGYSSMGQAEFYTK